MLRVRSERTLMTEKITELNKQDAQKNLFCTQTGKDALTKIMLLRLVLVKTKEMIKISAGNMRQHGKDQFNLIAWGEE